MRGIISITLFIAVLLLLNSCNKGYEPISGDSEGLKKIRIWQYLSGFSIYQDRVPTEDSALTHFSSPKEMVHSVHDTLRSWTKKPAESADYYGKYYANWETLQNELSGLESERHRNIFAPFFRLLTKDSTVAYLRFLAFTDKLGEQVFQYSDQIRNSDHIILDLRRNGGGYVHSCNTLIRSFLNPGDKAYRSKGRVAYLLQNGSIETVTRDTVFTVQDTTSVWRGKNWVVLTDRYSASASEILAVALKKGDEDPKKSVTLMGERTYGKAIGQSVFYFNRTSGDALKLTTVQFSGVTSIDSVDKYHERGIAPDIVYTGDSFDSLLTLAGTTLNKDFSTVVDETAKGEILKFDESLNGTTVNSPVQGINEVIYE